MFIKKTESSGGERILTRKIIFFSARDKGNFPSTGASPPDFPAISTDYIAVNLLVDDQGGVKNFPINERASRLCFIVGKPLKVLGDAFLARIFDNEEEFHRMDFSLSEYSTNETKWLEKAKQANSKENEKENAEKTRELKEMMAKSGAKFAYAASEDSCGAAGCPSAGLSRCSRCRAISYCSKDCQKADWPRHKTACQPKTSSAAQ